MEEDGVRNQGPVRHLARFVTPELVFGLPMAAVPKAKVIGNDRGSFKIIVNKADQTILGATHYGVMSPEVINFLALAIKTKEPYTEIRDFLFTHPTIAEALNDVLKQPK